MKTKKPQPIAESRRRFIKISGQGVLFCVTAPLTLGSLNACQEASSGRLVSEKLPYSDELGQKATLWVEIHESNHVTIYNPTNEMGQGSMTALAVILAEELDVDWSLVRLKDSSVDPDLYGSPGWNGNMMITVGSRTVNSYYDLMRQAGAQARYVLLSNVAREWKVPIDELSTKKGIVTHQKSGRRVTYGEISPFLKQVDPIPVVPPNKLKNPSEFELIGKVVDRYDIPSKVDGSAQFAIDVQIPDMVYAFMARSPVHGARPSLRNETEIRNMKGVEGIVSLDHGIGVIASSVEHALKAKKALSIEWDNNTQTAQHTSETAFSQYAQVAGDPNSKGQMIVDEGSTSSVIDRSSNSYTKDYLNDYICHAQMEPLNAIVRIADDGSSAELWVGTQAPSSNRSVVAKLLGIDRSKVTVHRYYLGGGFGRRATSDWIEETVLLAKAIKKPVKLIWTREDDIQYGMFRPMSLQRMTASFDDKGKISAWQHMIVGTGGRLLSSGAKTHFYSFPNQHVEMRNIDHGIRTKHWRAVGHGPNKFAIEAFIDELAAHQNKDALDFRLELMSKFPRAQKVLQTAAEMSKWSQQAPEGRAKGIAFAERSGSLSACVCELSVDQEDGTIKVHRIWASLDAGVIVQPDNAIAQMEGGIIMGMSSVLKESISIKNGRVQQSNFHDYPILRCDEAPESIEIELIRSNESPTGIGESGVPIIGGAISNAFYNLTGKRLRHLPFTKEKVLAALKNT